MNPGNGAGRPLELDPALGVVRARTQLGDFELTVCTDGTYKLDGGAMFGVVPKPLWDKQTAKMREIHYNQELLPHSLAAAGIRPEEVDVVINTHLHFDHCGWNTTLHADGSVTPTFPNARYFAHAGEVAHGRLQLDRDRVSYLAPNYEPLIESGQMTLLDTDGIKTDPTICPGISVELFPGHTAQLMAVHIESKS